MFLRSVLLIGVIIGPVLADDTLHPGTPQVDRPTLTALGVKLPITGDDNYNASVTMRYRKAGSMVWRDAMPLYRVRPDLVQGWSVSPSFAGSIFDLRPSTTYEVELHASDPDGSVDQVFSLTAATRAVPGYPANPNYIAVSDAQTFATVIGNLKAGDVVTLADGVYNGDFFEIHGEGTAENPIIVRGASTEGTILDGGNDPSGNVIEVYGSFIHVERLTLRNCLRALRFQTSGAEGDVVRNVHITDVNWGIGPQPDQKDFYIADNVVEGRLAWPLVYSDNNGANSDDDGIRVIGDGHVVAHNLIRGFGDAMKVSHDGARSVDFYGNEILWTYDNGIELDGAEGNARCFRNRFTNTFATLSVQPIHGGPAYLIRNVVINVAWEQMKFHALATVPPQDPVGVLAWHNTFVSPGVPLWLQSSSTSHYFAIENNLFVGPSSPPYGEIVDWTGVVDHGIFDYNGYFTDGLFAINLPAQGGYKHYNNLAALQAVGVETHGLILAAPVFANGLVPPASYTVLMQPADVTPAVSSNAVDRGLELPNINDSFTGAGPDLGAVERGCPLTLYGPRAAGIDETNEPFGCGPVSLKIGQVQTGSLYEGQTGAAYSIRVSNIGGAATSGIVTVTSALPASLSPTAIAGVGWSCTLVPLACKQYDVLPPGGVYPDIVVTVQVAADAPATANITAAVSGGGDVDTDTSVDSIAISPTVAVTVGAAPPGFAYIVDGLTYSTVQTFKWPADSLHSLSVVTSQTAGGMRGVFGGWSNGVTGASQTITVPLTGATYTAAFTNLQYSLTSAAYPSAAGSVTNGWYNANTSVAVTATAQSGYQFHHFSGDLSGTANPQSITISGPKYVVANFTALAPSLSARISGKTGPDNARVWTLQLVNVGAGPADDALFAGLTFTQTYGVPCSPGVAVLTPLPARVGTLAPLSGSGAVLVTVNFGGCPAGARFTLVANIQANGGAYTASSTLANQIR